MTQPETAVGGASDTIVAAEPTLEDRLSAAIGEEEKKPEESEETATADTELTVEDVAEAEAETGEDAGQPPIQPPVSWTTEEKDEFKNLPRELQETLTRREGEREKFVQTKAQEAKQATTEAERRAIGQLEERLTAHASELQTLFVVPPQKPSHQLQADDPWAYAEQMDAHDRAVAHNQWVEQRIANARHEAQRASNVLRNHALQETEAALKDDFPEYLDPTKGPELKQKLASTALELGYSEEQLADVDHRDIKAMRTATEWRDKASKYDRLMAQKMERVRAAKDMPRVSRPGTAQGPGVAKAQQYAADREAMRNGDQDAAARAIGRFLK